MQYPNRLGPALGVLLVMFVANLPVFAQDHAEALEWFQDARFGIFLHWTCQSISGDWIENSGLDFGEERPNRKEQIERFREFNPVHFDAEAWVDIIKRSGAKYASFTSKHVLGFCMWDNPYSEFDIMSTPFKRDICKELSDALRKQDLGIFWYYGSSDRQHPDYEGCKKDPKSPFYDYQSKTVECLLTKYGRITGMWWDGSQAFHNKELMDMAKKLQPHLLMTGRYHKPSGDFYTPEQVVGAFDITKPWESCIPIQGITWMWNGGRDIKDVPTCLRALVQCAIGGGNLLLNISPKPDGTLQQEQVDVLLAMGNWLKQYGSSIYGTRGGPYKPAGWGGSTRKGNRVYLHVMQHIEDGQLVLPALPLKIKNARALTDGDASLIETEEQLVISLDDTARHPDLVTVIELELDGDAMALKPIETGPDHQTLVAGIRATASSKKFPKTRPNAVVYLKAIEEKGNLYRDLERAQNRGEPIPEKLAKLPKYPFSARKRGYRFRYWMAAENDPKPWLAFDLGSPKTFKEVHILERGCRVRGFKLQYKEADNWVTFYKGKRMNFFDVNLETPVTAQEVRILFTKTEGGTPGITLVDLF